MLTDENQVVSHSFNCRNYKRLLKVNETLMNHGVWTTAGNNDIKS